MEKEGRKPLQESREGNPLRQLLALVVSQGVLSEGALASSLGVPRDLVHEMCAELERAGYLRSATAIDASCAGKRLGPSQTLACGGCQIRNLCLGQAPGLPRLISLAPGGLEAAGRILSPDRESTNPPTR